MGDKTGIEWTDATWNPVTGCTKVSHGCKNCYAERDWNRMVHLPAYKGRAFTDVACHPERLIQPLRWKRPRRIFVNSMSDLFHESVPFEFIDQVFAAMAICPQHTFQVLTKRPERMRDYTTRLSRSAKLLDDAARTMGYSFEHEGQYLVSFPLPNVWLGVSVEDQQTADERIPLLLQTPAAVRWVSAEPLLGTVDFRFTNGLVPGQDAADYRLDWVVVGGESGPHARPMHPRWVRSIRLQCAREGIPFLFKQWGEWAPNCLCGREKACKTIARPGPGFPGLMFRCGKKAAGRLLDGVLHDEYPSP